MKILITNSVPLNGGDQALLHATVKGLSLILPNTELDFTVLCSDPVNCSRYLPEYSFNWDYERSFFIPVKGRKERIKNLFRKAYLSLTNPDYFYHPKESFSGATQQIVYLLYQEADLVISSPGGYLHDYYGYKSRAKVFQLAQHLGKPVILLGQSLGPFWKTKDLPLLREVLSKMKAIILREKLSVKHLNEAGVVAPYIQVTTDLAFALPHFYPDWYEVKKKPKVTKVAMVFRAWKNDKTSHKIVEDAVAFCSYLLTKYDLSITFLSTCQGISNYHDDSLTAQKIIDLLAPDLKQRCDIDGVYHDFQTLIKKYRQFDAYIGMRLHGAIFSMLGGTPAMNVGYEEKTKGIYQFLGLEDYQVSYLSPVAEWCQTADLFLKNCNEIHRQLPEILKVATEEALKGFDPVSACIEEILTSKT